MSLITTNIAFLHSEENEQREAIIHEREMDVIVRRLIFYPDKAPPPISYDLPCPIHFNAIQYIEAIEKKKREEIDITTFKTKALALSTLYARTLRVQDPHQPHPRSAGATIPDLHGTQCYQGRFEASLTQSYFEKWYVQQIESTAFLLRSLRPTAQDVLDALSLARSGFAFAVGAKQAGLVGVRRGTSDGYGLVTPMNAQRYQKYNLQVLALANQSAYGLIPDAKQEKVALTTMDSEENIGIIEHTLNATVEIYWPKIEPHITDAANRVVVRKTEDPSATLQDLAFIHWWLAHLCLFHRGSASITEIYILALCHAAGFTNASWVKGNFPDLEALCCLELEDFQKNYGSTCLILA